MAAVMLVAGGNDPMSLRRQLADSVVTRSIRVAVDQHQGETFDMVTATN